MELACRHMAKAEAAADRIRFELEAAAATEVTIAHDSEWVGANYSGVGTVEVMELDLADLDSVRIPPPPPFLPRLIPPVPDREPEAQAKLERKQTGSS